MTRYYPEDPPREGNVSYNFKFDGDLEEGWREADFVIEYDVNVNDIYVTSPNPYASVAFWDKDPNTGADVLHLEGMVHRTQSIQFMYGLRPENFVHEGMFQGGKYCDWGLRISQEVTPLLSRRMGGRPVRCCHTPVSYTHLDVYKRQIQKLLQGYMTRKRPERTNAGNS